ncbi:MAG: transcriptional repressor [bacterium]|nr:transcriptional repressor [bacterium]
MKVKFYVGTDRKILQALLRDRGFYSTEGRLELLSIVKSANRLVSVPEVVAKLPGRLDEVNVYRALEAFARAGILSRSDLRGGGTRYEMVHGRHHHHVVCNGCGVTEDVEECADKSLETRVLKSSDKFAAINTHALEFFGTCKTCVNK